MTDWNWESDLNHASLCILIPPSLAYLTAQPDFARGPLPLKAVNHPDELQYNNRAIGSSENLPVPDP
jgi:hypothetical protein